jgi:HEAT repeat protein
VKFFLSHLSVSILTHPFSFSPQHFGVTIVFMFAVAAALFVVMMSLLLVFRKGIEVRRKKVRESLSKNYSSLFANILIQDLPPQAAEMSAGERFRFYELSLLKVKERVDRLPKRTRQLHTSVMRSVLIEYLKDLKGETTEKILYYIYSLSILDEPIIMMDSRRWWIRATAAKELGLLQAKRAIVPLTAALEDSHPDVQFQAMQSLLMIVGVSALRNILRLSKSVSQGTAVALSVIILEYREEAVPYLLESLTSSSPSVVLFSIALLGQIGFVSAVKPLIQFCLSNPEPVLYGTAIETLGRLGDERAFPVVFTASQHSHTSIRLKALEALGRLGEKKGMDVLIDRMRQGDIAEKRIAAHALSHLSNDGMNALNDLLNSPDTVTRMIALEVTEEIERGRGLS